MRKHPITIALALAGIIAGTHAGIAAIDTESAENIAETVAMQESAATQTEAQAPADTVEATMQADASVPYPVAEPAGFKAGSQTDVRMVRIPFTNRYLRVTNPTFPSSANEVTDQLPGTVAYFDSRTNIMLTGAPGPVFPSAALENSDRPLPAMVAHWDRIEAQRFASTAPAPTTIASIALPQQPAAAGD